MVYFSHYNVVKGLFFFCCFFICSWWSRRYFKAETLCGDLLLEDVLQSNSIGGELGDTFSKLLNGHLVLVEVEAEESLVVQVALLRDIKLGGAGGVKLLRNSGGRVIEILEEVGLKEPKHISCHAIKIPS